MGITSDSDHATLKTKQGQSEGSGEPLIFLKFDALDFAFWLLCFVPLHIFKLSEPRHVALRFAAESTDCGKDFPLIGSRTKDLLVKFILLHHILF